MRVLMVAVVAVVAACASGGSSSGTLGDRNVLTLEEIRAADQVNTFDLIQVHRPWWLRKRGNSSFTRETPIMVYMDGTELGGTEELRQIATIHVREIRFYSASRATLRFGTGNPSGAIELLTR